MIWVYCCESGIIGGDDDDMGVDVGVGVDVDIILDPEPFCTRVPNGGLVSVVVDAGVGVGVGGGFAGI